MVVKSCIFTGCENTSSSHPDKLFLCVPENYEKKKLWFEAAGRTRIPLGRGYYCCEDHFDLEHDAANWMYYKMMGTRIILKEGVVPAKKRKQAMSPQLTASAKKRKETVMSKLSVCRQLFQEEAGPSTSSFVAIEKSPSGNFVVQESPEKIEPDAEFQMVETGSKQYHSTRTKSTKRINTDLKMKELDTIMDTVSKLTSKTFDEKATNTTESHVEQSSSSDSTDTDFPSSASVYEPSTSSKSDITTKENTQELEFQKIVSHPRFFLGIPQSEYFIIEVLQSATMMRLLEIFIVLKKIRTDDPFKRLGIDFAISESGASKIFNRSLPKIAAKMRELIFWPEKTKIMNLVPPQFRTFFKDVQAIFDCFEIKIEKSSSALKQALTWSSYKTANTSKFLVSMTPNGLVNFISSGFGGRTSDLEIIKKSNYVDAIPPNATIMTDRGFKQIVGYLNAKGIQLVKPPSVFNQRPMSVIDARQTKLIAACRVHVERLIRRLREFSMLVPAADTHHSLVPLLDDIIIVACAIINLQGPLIK